MRRSDSEERARLVVMLPPDPALTHPHRDDGRDETVHAADAGIEGRCGQHGPRARAAGNSDGGVPQLHQT